MALLSIVLATSTLYFAIKVHAGGLGPLGDSGHEPDRDLNTLVFLTGIWAVLAPAWFWLEYWFLYRPFGNPSPEAFEHFKFSQQLSAAIWAGVVLVAGFVISQALPE